MKILVLNAGSSSQKSCLYEVARDLPDSQPEPLWEAQADEDGLKVSTSAGAKWQETLDARDSYTGVSHLLQTLWSGPTAVIQHPGDIDIVGHRVVHGGREYICSTRVTEKVKEVIHRLAPLAPAHNLAAFDGIEAVEHLFGLVPQIAVFDTAFHASLPDAAAVYPIPFKLTEEGIRRYGFHGISHEDAAHRTAKILKRDINELRLIICHLGNGCSLCAVQGGKSVDTTMGFTPLEGLMMGTRSGSVDPGILLYWMREKGLSADELDRMLNQESGLKGVSGLSGDLRNIDAAIAKGNARAQLAFDVYVHRLRSGVGAMLATLGGLDALVFTGGVGEHSPAIRAAVCGAFGFLGVSVARDKNESATFDGDIAAPESKVRVVIIEAQEDWAIARQCWKFARS